MTLHVTLARPQRVRCGMALCFAIAGTFTLCITEAVAAQEPSRLYLIAATPSDDILHPSYENLLLSVSADSKIQLDRALVSDKDGIEAVRMCAAAVFILWPVRVPHMITLIHKDTPTEVDTVPINAANEFADTGLMACYEAETGESGLLIPFGLPNVQSDHVIAVSSMRGSKRISSVGWSAFKNMRILGDPGGPMIDGEVEVRGERIADTIGIFSGSQYQPIVSIPPADMRSLPMGSLQFLARNEAFTVMVPQLTQQQVDSGVSTRMVKTEVFIIGANSEWRKIAIPGSCSSSQLFSHWLASIVSYYSPGYGDGLSPRGLREGESEDVERLYRSEAAKDCKIPGLLGLQNLQSNRATKILTGREDGEILLVDHDTVWYRIKDEVWRGVISGSKLIDVRTLAKDNRIVQAHWAFLGRGRN